MARYLRSPRFSLRHSLHAAVPTLSGGFGSIARSGHLHGICGALSDDGSLTGRGHPWIRGAVCGLMTAMGGIGTRCVPDSRFRLAMTAAVIVVVAELAVISYIRHRYMDTPFLSATLRLWWAGRWCFITGILIGSS